MNRFQNGFQKLLPIYLSAPCKSSFQLCCNLFSGKWKYNRKTNIPPNINISNSNTFLIAKHIHTHNHSTLPSNRSMHNHHLNWIFESWEEQLVKNLHFNESLRGWATTLSNLPPYPLICICENGIVMFNQALHNLNGTIVNWQSII